jgi:DNA adenine methylase
MHGFCKYGCSWGGKPWGGMARDGHGRNYAAQARKALLRDVLKIAGFAVLNFLAEKPAPTELLIYCDPPYRGRTSYGTSFDHAAFDALCKRWARYTTVLVSEYKAPGVCVWERKRSAALRGAENSHVERLYLISP